MKRHNLALVVNRPAAAAHAIAPLLRGYHVQYHPGQPNHCPGCGRDQWLVGRATAECAFCATALPIGSNLFATREEFQ